MLLVNHRRCEYKTEFKCRCGLQQYTLKKKEQQQSDVQ